MGLSHAGDEGRMSKWGDVRNWMPVFLQLLAGHKKEMKSVPCKECKAGQTPKCCYTEKIKQAETKP